MEDSRGNNGGNINREKVNIPYPAPSTHCNMEQFKAVQTLGTQETCYCCRHYGRSCLQNSFSKEIVESSQPHDLDASKKTRILFPDQRLRGSFQSFSTLPEEFQQQTLNNPKQSRKNKQVVKDQTNNVQDIHISEWSITYSEFRPRERKRHQKCTDAKIKSDSHQCSKKQSDSHQCSKKQSDSLQCSKKQSDSHQCSKKQSDSHQCSKKQSDSHQCSEKQSDSHQCSKKQKIIIKPKKPVVRQAQVNYVNVEQAKQATDVLLGEILMNSKPVTTLFDSRTSHSFISTKLVEEHNLVSLVMRRPITLQLHGKEVCLRHGCPGIQLHIVGTKFKLDAAILETEGIDIILGKNWLSSCKGVVDHDRKTVYLTNMQGIEVEFEAIPGNI